jgi:hypothetical protein
VRPSGSRLAERAQDDVEVRALGASRHEAQRMIGEEQRPDGVLLLEHEVGERRAQAARVLDLAHRRPWRLERHRPREIEHQVAAEIGLFRVLLDQQPVAARHTFQSRFLSGSPRM